MRALLTGICPDHTDRFWRWFEAAYKASIGDPLLTEGMAAWAAVINSPEILAWWGGDAGGKPPLPAAVLMRGLGGVSRIEPAEHGWYTPASYRAGLPAVTWCAFDGIEALDIVAMDPGDPSRWWRRTCRAEILPGEMELEMLEAGATIRLYEHPLAWLAAGCPALGFCVLDWAGRVGQGLLIDIDGGRYRVVCDSDAHSRRVKALARPKRKAMQLVVACESMPQAAGRPRETDGAPARADGAAQGPAPAGSVGMAE